MVKWVLQLKKTTTHKCGSDGEWVPLAIGAGFVVVGWGGGGGPGHAAEARCAQGSERGSGGKDTWTETRKNYDENDSFFLSYVIRVKSVKYIS